MNNVKLNEEAEKKKEERRRKKEEEAREIENKNKQAVADGENHLLFSLFHWQSNQCNTLCKCGPTERL